MSPEPPSPVREDSDLTIRLLQDEIAETNREVLALTLELEKRVDERTAELRGAQQELRRINSELEARVALRTSELASSNEALRREAAEREQAQKALAESHARKRAIIETALDGIITMDDEGRIVDFNPAAERIFGHRRDDVVGHLLIDVILPPALREEHPGGLARYLPTADEPLLGKRIELTGLRSDGSEAPLEFSIVQMPGTGPAMFTSFVRDITERKQAEQKVESQLRRLDLLSRTTRAIGERQDLRSILQVVVRSLEESLPIDFGCVCLCGQPGESLTVACVGMRSEALAAQLAMAEQARIAIDANGLSQCVRGQLVYEPDIALTPFPFPQRLARGGLRSLVAAPLLIEGRVFGVLVSARRRAHGFSSGECEFLRQLSEHVALAANQAQLYGALRQAYDDLRQTQETVMQQERLRALGQMASGIAHDINNAISPVTLYTEALLETEPGLRACKEISVTT